MPQDSDFDTPFEGDGQENTVNEPESVASPMSGVRAATKTSGTYSLRVVSNSVADTLGPVTPILEKLFQAEPKAQIIWNALVEIKADLSVIEKRLHATIRPEYFLSLLKDYIFTIHIALDVRSGNQKNVHVFQHKDDVRSTAESFAEGKDTEMAAYLMSIILAAVTKIQK